MDKMPVDLAYATAQLYKIKPLENNEFGVMVFSDPNQVLVHVREIGFEVELIEQRYAVLHMLDTYVCIIKENNEAHVVVSSPSKQKVKDTVFELSELNPIFSKDNCRYDIDSFVDTNT